MMIFKLIIFPLFMNAQELPEKLAIQPISVPNIGTQNVVHIRGEFQIPKKFKSTKMPKNLDVYSRTANQWKLVQSIPEASLSFFREKNTIRFDEHITVPKDSQELALDLSVSFCNKICVINNFRGHSKRESGNANDHLTFTLAGLMPDELK